MAPPWPCVRLSFPTPGQVKEKRAYVTDGLAWVPGQVEVGGGCPLLLALARALDLLPHLDRDTLLAVAELLVAVLSENQKTSSFCFFVTIFIFLPDLLDVPGWTLPPDDVPFALSIFILS